MDVFPECLSLYYCEGQKKMPDPPELELQTLVSTLWVLEIET